MGARKLAALLSFPFHALPTGGEGEKDFASGEAPVPKLFSIYRDLLSQCMLTKLLLSPASGSVSCFIIVYPCFFCFS